MFKHLPKLAIGFSTLAAAQLISIATAPSASAFSISGTSITGLNNTTDIGKGFMVEFGGNVEGTNVTGLSSKAYFTFRGFRTSGGNTNALFDILLQNTSGNGISSRVSALGFNTSATERTSGSSTAALAPSNTPLFSNASVGGSFPNGFGNIDICFTNGNTCSGGQSGGVTNYVPGANDGVYQIGRFKGTVALSGSVTNLSLNNFGVRYQSISGNGYRDDSGTGRVKSIMVYDPNGPTKIPEPTATVALGVVALSGLASRKRKAVAQA